MAHIKKVMLVLVGLLVLTLLFGQEVSPEGKAKELARKGAEQYGEKQFAQAIESFQEALAIFKEIRDDLVPFDAEIEYILRNLFNSAFNAKKYDLAAQYGEEYLAIYDSHEPTVKNLALVYTRFLKDNTKAIEVWKRYDDKYNSFAARTAIGDIYVADKKLDEAIEWYNLAIAMNPDPDIIEKVARLYIEKKDPARAIRMYKEFIESDPPPSERSKGIAYRNMGTLYKDMKDIPNAVEYYELALNIIDYNRDITLWLVDQYFNKPMFPEAKVHIQKMLAQNPNDGDAIYFNAEILYKEGKYPEAKAEFNKIKNHAKYGAYAQRAISDIDKR
jgi:tetratricopeptide (TPR) repeat protein